MNATIPVYRADGRLYDHVTDHGLARLQAAGLIARVVRHRKGHINRAILFVRPGEAPMPRTAYMGTRYSFEDHLEHGLCWDLKRLRCAHLAGIRFYKLDQKTFTLGSRRLQRRDSELRVQADCDSMNAW